MRTMQEVRTEVFTGVHILWRIRTCKLGNVDVGVQMLAMSPGSGCVFWLQRDGEVRPSIEDKIMGTGAVKKVH